MTFHWEKALRLFQAYHVLNLLSSVCQQANAQSVLEAAKMVDISTDATYNTENVSRDTPFSGTDIFIWLTQ
jgi:hypothetical protein